MKVNKLEPIVLEILENKPVSRTDDFVLYGFVLQKFGISLDLTLRRFFTIHKKLKAPSFKSVERCRRKITSFREDLKDDITAVARDDKQQEYKLYNLTSNGGN